MVKRTDAELFSALVTRGSKSDVLKLPDVLVMDPDAREIMQWLKAYVTDYRRVPSAKIMKRQTGFKAVEVSEGVSYYQDEARKRLLYTEFLGPFGDLRDAMADKSPEEVVLLARQIIGIYQTTAARDDGIAALYDVARDVVADYHIARHTVGLRGTSSGWTWMDEQTDGFQKGDLITFVGRPGVGKSTLLLYTALHSWLSGNSVLFLSMEMPALQLVRRFIGLWTGINPQLIKRGRLSTDARDFMTSSIEGIPDMPEFRIMAGNFRKSVGSLRAAAEEMEPDEIDADASYLIQPDSKANNKASRRENAADTIEGLKMLALDLDRPLKQSVQFNRAATKPKSSGTENANPVAHLGLDKIGETDVIGQSSSIVVGIETGDPPHAHSERYLGILKGREGEFGWMKINYQFQPANFSQITTSAEANRPALTGTRPVDLSHMDSVA